MLQILTRTTWNMQQPSVDTQHDQRPPCFFDGTTSARMTQHPQFPQNPFVFPPTWAQQIMFPPMHGMNPTSQCFPAMYDKSLGTPGLQQAPLNSSQVDASRMPSGKQYRSESMPHTPVPMYHPAASSSWHQNICPSYAHEPIANATTSTGMSQVSYVATRPTPVSVPMAAVNNTYLNPRGTNGKFVSPRLIGSRGISETKSGSTSDEAVGPSGSNTGGDPVPKNTILSRRNTEEASLLSMRRRDQRRELTDYMQHRRHSSTERHTIRTDKNGEPLVLKQVLNNAIRDIAGRVLDVSIIHFSEHPLFCFELIQHDLDRQFFFEPPLRENYVKDFLQSALGTARCQWRKHWKKTGLRHKNCPERRFPALVSYWCTPAAELESLRMQRARKLRRRTEGSTIPTTDSTAPRTATGDETVEGSEPGTIDKNYVAPESLFGPGMNIDSCNKDRTSICEQMRSVAVVARLADPYDDPEIPPQNYYEDEVSEKQ